MAVFGDIRVAGRADWFLQRIVATGSLVLKRLGGNRAGGISAHRLLSSPHASLAAQSCCIDRYGIGPHGTGL